MPVVAEGSSNPEGKVGDLLVCCHLSPTHWEYEPVASREEANALFAQWCQRPDVYWWLVEYGAWQGKRHPVVWISECLGGRHWQPIKSTPGSEDYLTEDDD
jgi:hypothetical protein